MKDELLEVLSRASSTQLALESLRANDIGRALEFLEMDLDGSVLALSRLAKEVGPARRESLLSMLRQIRAYRQFHPRRAEADLGTVANGVVNQAVRMAQKRVGKILDEME